MKQKLKKIALLIMLSVISLVFLRCQSEENAVDNSQDRIKTVTTDEAKDFLKNSKNNSFAKSANSQLENLEFDKIAQEKINGSDQLLTIIPFATNNDLENDRILLLKIENEIKSVIFKMYPDENSVKGSFSGKLLVYSIDGNYINGFRAKDGFIVSQFVDNDNAVKNNSTGKSAVQLKEVVVQNNYRNTVNALDVFGAQGMFVDFGGGNSYYSWDVGDGGSGIAVPTNAQIAAELEKQIDGSQLDPCTKVVLEKLKNLTQSDIANIFEKFGIPTNGTYSLKIIMGTPNSSVAIADTRQVSKNNYLITIRDTYLKGSDNNQRAPTDLAIATIIIHEIIHAHFFALYDDFHNNGDICAYDKNYDCLFMEYVSKNFEGTTDPQHTQMFENYVDVMANALQEFQTGIPVQNKGKAELFYHDLALSTLGATQIFKDRYPLSYNSPTYEERRRIVNTRTAEDKNETIDDGEKGKYIPKGKSCTN